VSDAPKWVKEMHEHRGQTGSFRTGDVLRVLGDPRKAVEVPLTNEHLAAARRIKR
jgi:hypothetical protein